MVQRVCEMFPVLNYPRRWVPVIVNILSKKLVKINQSNSKKINGLIQKVNIMFVLFWYSFIIYVLSSSVFITKDIEKLQLFYKQHNSRYVCFLKYEYLRKKNTLICKKYLLRSSFSTKFHVFGYLLKHLPIQLQK